MPTFVLKKYEEKPVTKEPDTEQPSEQPESTNTVKTVQKEMEIDVSGSISEIVANALNKVFANTGVDIEEKEESSQTEGGAAAISVETIRIDPVSVLRKAKSASVIVFAGESFHTKEDEWFLVNMEDYKGKVFYSVEKFVNYLVSEMCDESNH